MRHNETITYEGIILLLLPDISSPKKSISKRKNVEKRQRVRGR